MNQALISQLLEQLPPERVLTRPEQRIAYSFDNSRLQVMPELVVLASNEAEVMHTIRWCYQHRIPVTCRGRGTATTGAAVPVAGGIVLSTERMNRIVAVDPANRVIVAQPGVTNGEIQRVAAEHGFFWAPDPTSRESCSIGGNLACNSAGPRAVKYGTPRENVLGLRAVDGVGESFATGCYTTKGVVGYDLTRLLIGSEGTLAVITQATLRLIPLADERRTLRLSFGSVAAAAAAIAAIMAQPTIPYSLEFMDGKAIEMIRHYAGLQLPEGSQALLLCEVEGSKQSIDAAVSAVIMASQHPQLLESFVAISEDEVQQLWLTRKSLSPALRNVAPKKINEDIVVPVAALPHFMAELKRIESHHQLTIVCFGHAGNGNIHVNLLVNPDLPAEMAAADQALAQIFQLTLELKGTLSGEHGIGIVKREFVPLEIGPTALRLMWAIKQQFDPHMILNPGKSLPDVLIPTHVDCD